MNAGEMTLRRKLTPPRFLVESLARLSAVAIHHKLTNADRVAGPSIEASRVTQFGTVTQPDKLVSS
jgi:hypothetical protein